VLCLLFKFSKISSSISLSGWLFCRMGCFRCVFIRYSKLRLSVNIHVSSSLFSDICSASRMAVSSSLSMFWSLGSLFDILIFVVLLYMPYPGVPSSCSSGGLYDPCV